MPSQWDIKINVNELKMGAESNQENCSEFQKCMEILQLMLDNEASKDETSYVEEHIDQCMVCFEQYEVEKQIRELIRKKVANIPVPSGLADQIRSKIHFARR